MISFQTLALHAWLKIYTSEKNTQGYFPRVIRARKKKKSARVRARVLSLPQEIPWPWSSQIALSLFRMDPTAYSAHLTGPKQKVKGPVSCRTHVVQGVVIVGVRLPCSIPPPLSYFLRCTKEKEKSFLQSAAKNRPTGLFPRTCLGAFVLHMNIDLSVYVKILRSLELRSPRSLRQ